MSIVTLFQVKIVYLITELKLLLFYRDVRTDQ